MIEELAQKYRGQIAVARMNVDDNPDTPARFGIKSVPTIILFNNGSIFEQLTGVVSRPALEKSLEKLLTGAAPSAPFVVQ